MESRRDSIITFMFLETYLYYYKQRIVKFDCNFNKPTHRIFSSFYYRDIKK